MINASFLEEKNLWKHLQRTSLPIVLYGMGNGADKILGVLDSLGIEISDIFASDGFVRGHSFHGKQVLSLSEIREKYESCIILLAFGSALPDVMKNIRALSDEYELYAPDVPVCGTELFSAEFFKLHKAEIDAARALLADEESKETYDAILAYKLTGRIDYLQKIDSPKENALRHLLSGGYTAYADLGAYTGDTIKEILRIHPKINQIIALEPSAKIFRKLSFYLETLAPIQTAAYPLCAWNQSETVLLTDGAGRNTAIGADSDKCKTKNGATVHPITCEALDTIISFQNEKLLIKYDVEGAEKEALLGSVRTIQANNTDLIVSLYHRSGDLFELPLLVHSLFSHHRIYLRKHPYIPAWDINLYACENL